MKLSLLKSDLKKYVLNQISCFFPDGESFDSNDVDFSIDLAIQRTEFCFKHINLPYYHGDNGETFFYHLHSDQYSIFLYFLSNTLWNKSQNKGLCDKLVLLNKMLNSIFISYKCCLPDIFLLIHPVGTVLGNAMYSNFLVVLQNVTVNTGDDTGIYNPPKLGKGVFLSAGSKVIGSNTIGDYTSIGVNTCVYKMDVPDRSVVFADSFGKLNIKAKIDMDCHAQSFFNVDIEKYVHKKRF